MGRAIDEAIWAQRWEWIGKQRSSGLSVAQFCRKYDLSIANFHAWKRRLSGTATIDPQATGKVLTKQVRGQGVFVQVPAAVHPVAPATPWVEISQADGMVVRVPASNLAALKMVLGILGSTEEMPGV